MDKCLKENPSLKYVNNKDLKIVRLNVNNIKQTDYSEMFDLHVHNAYLSILGKQLLKDFIKFISLSKIFMSHDQIVILYKLDVYSYLIKIIHTIYHKSEYDKSKKCRFACVNIFL